MTSVGSRYWFTPVVFLLTLAGCVFAQSATKPATPPHKDLVVNGKTSAGAVLQIDGRSYVDVEAFAQAVNAGVSFETGKVILTFSAPNVEVKVETKQPGLSREFAQTGIAAVSDMREWRGAIASTIRFGVAAGTWLGPFLQDYQIRAQKSLSQATLAAKSEPDHQAAELLKSEFSNLKQWDGQTQTTIQSLNAEQAINPEASQNDPLRMKIADCSTFLDSMLVSGKFEDNVNCH